MTHGISRFGTLLCSASFKGLACLGRLENEEETNTQTNDTAKLGSGGQGSLMEKPHYSRNCLLHTVEQGGGIIAPS